MLTVLLSSCSDDDLPVAAVVPEEETAAETIVPINISLGTDWDTDTDGTRAAPPGMGDNVSWVDGLADVTGEYAIDKVRIIAFRRKDMDNTVAGTSNEPFVYDRGNDAVYDMDGVPKDETDHGYAHKHLTATAALKKMYGYEYRVIALAYSSTRQLPYASIALGQSGGNWIAQQLQALIGTGQFITPSAHWWGEENFYVTSGTTYDDFAASLVVQDIKNENGYWREFLTGSGTITHKTGCIAGKAVAVPQFFWGYCHAGDSEPVIKYASENASGDMDAGMELTGILYRGVAKIELHTKRAQHDSHSLSWMVLMADNVLTKVGLNSYDDFLNPTGRLGSDNKYTAIGGMSTAGIDGEMVLTAWVLPCVTRLALRGFTITDKAVFNGQLLPEKNVSSGVNGTGIISADVVNGQFYLRRNHKYVLYAANTETIFGHKLE